jgi:leucyl-tRNA synthetase
MSFYPEEARAWFNGIIDWLQDWPCARKTGLGTPIPWSPGWIVETLSDSTIYMAYYMVSKFVNAGTVKAEQLTPQVFDHIYYGSGGLAELSKQSGVDRQVLGKMREEFLYWYPVDLRNSGKDLVANHLSFFIFNHVALFEQKYWPRAIGVNGFLLAEGRPMHKSQGNFVPLWKVCEQYGADSVRCTVLLAAEGMDDPDWRYEKVRDVKGRLEAFLRLVEDTASRPNQRASNGHLETWLTERLYAKARQISEAIQKLKTRTALALAIYDLWNDLRWYERRATTADSGTVRTFVSNWIRLLAPFAPHTAEEAGRILGESGFVSTAEWPKFEEQREDVKSDELEELVKQILEDTQEIIATTKITPKKVHYFTAAQWRWQVYNEALTRATSQPETLDGLIRDMLVAKTGSAKDLPKFAVKVIQQARTMSAELRDRRLKVGTLDERKALSEAREFFARELKVEVQVHAEQDDALYDPKGRARFAEPYRPAIFIE